MFSARKVDVSGEPAVRPGMVMGEAAAANAMDEWDLAIQLCEEYKIQAEVGAAPYEAVQDTRDAAIRAIASAKTLAPWDLYSGEVELVTT